jgi:peptidoglycan/LPS O-acetylase OafA/YrhL
MGYVRFLLALSVLLAHAGPLPFVGRMAGGEVAVQCFFILSGFYMALVLNEKYAAPWSFYWNRLSRIFSGYWVALAAAAALMLLSRYPWMGLLSEAGYSPVETVLLAVANAFLVGADWLLFIQSEPPLHQFLLIAPAWSLPIELAFYAIAPFVVRSWPRLLLLAGASIFARWLVAQHVSGGPWDYRFAPSEMVFFCAGALAYRLKSISVHQAARLVAVAAIVIAVIGYESLRIGWAVYPLLALAAPFALGARLPIEKTLGEASYMLYLIHVPVMAFLPFVLKGPAPVWLTLACSLAATAALHPIAAKLDRYARRSISPNDRLAEPSTLAVTNSRYAEVATGDATMKSLNRPS